MTRLCPWLAIVLAARGAHAEDAPSASSPVVPASTPHADASLGREFARERFEAGVALASAGRHADARAEFLKAYAAAPHFIVLYNLGLVDIQLGNLESAAQFLRQYLAEGGDVIAAEQRDLVVREVERIEALGAAPPEGAGASVPQARNEPPLPSSHLLPVSQRSSIDADERTSSASRALAQSSNSAAPDARSPLPGYLLVGGGFLALAGAAVAHVWNHDRYLDWRRRHEELAVLREMGAPIVEDEASLRARIDDANARLRSVQRFDPVPIVLAGLGVIASGVGVWTLTRTNDDSHFRIASQPSELMLETSWTW
jgi:tetratricopeptide (TPR) repeat protein